MTNLDENIKDEIEHLSQEEEIFELEDLIINGEKKRIPVIVEIPEYNEETGEMIVKKFTARLKPLTNVEVNNARELGLKVKNTTTDVEILKRGLYTKNNTLFPAEFIEALPAGTVEELSLKIAEISGIKFNEDDAVKLAKDIMGF